MALTDPTPSTAQPRPVAVAARWVAGAALIANGLPPLLLAFEVIAWTVDQLSAYGVFVNVLVAGLSIILGSRAEDRVTPVESPRDHDGIPLIPITQALPAEPTSPVVIMELDQDDNGL